MATVRLIIGKRYSLKDNLDIALTVHNLVGAKRGLERVQNLCHSLSTQSLNCVWVMDSSNKLEYAMLHKMLKDFSFVKHIHIHQDIFNKPKLLNQAMKLSDAKWFMCTDADYIFKKDLLEVCRKHRSEDRLLLKEVNMLPRIAIDYNMIDKWKFPKAPKNQFGKIADGALQYTTRAWFEKVGGYDERMDKLCGMDNDLHARAKRDGLIPYWIEESQILHQWHPHSPMKLDNQARRNWKIRDKDKTINRNKEATD